MPSSRCMVVTLDFIAASWAGWSTRPPRGAARNAVTSSAVETIWPGPRAEGLTSDVTSRSCPGAIGSPGRLPR